MWARMGLNLVTCMCSIYLVTCTRKYMSLVLLSCTTFIKMPHCCYGTCNSDHRYQHKAHMEGVFFIPFPKPILSDSSCDKTQKCLRWIHACGRPDGDLNKFTIDRNTYICSLHFVGGKGPTDDHPDPIPATACAEQHKKDMHMY